MKKSKRIHRPSGLGRTQRRGQSTTVAILGRPARRWRARNASAIKPKWRPFYRKLLAAHEALRAQRSGLIKDAAQPLATYSQHMGDAATDEFDRELVLSELSADQEAIYEVEAALRRLEAGTYGICELTGQPIPKARLAAVPWTRFTAAAEAKLEQRGELNRTRLRPVVSVRTDQPKEIEAELEQFEKEEQAVEGGASPADEQLTAKTAYTVGFAPARRRKG